MSYAAALFCQLFAQELRRPGLTHRARISRAMDGLSPTLPPQEHRRYVNSLLDTITQNGALRPDWQERVRAEH